MTHFLLLISLFFLPLSDNGDITGRAGDVPPAEDYQTVLSTILSDIVTADGLVQYDKLTGEHQTAFRSVLKAIETYDLSQVNSDADKLAFWMNAYNVQMMQNIVDAPEVKDIIADNAADRFFKTAVLTAGLAISLDQIENIILRRQNGPENFKILAVSKVDFRIHVGLNCAAISCPQLRHHAFRADKIDHQLNKALTDFVNSENHFAVKNGKIQLSALIQWFFVDFDGTNERAGDIFISKMATDRPDYQTLVDALKGKSAAALADDSSIEFVYLWPVNRAN